MSEKRTGEIENHMEEQKKKIIQRLSIRGLVEFLLRDGDLDNRLRSGSDTAMQEGSRIHRMIQRRMGSSYHAEVPLVYSWVQPEYTLVLEGRADGIQEEDPGKNRPVMVDEIKTVYKDLRYMEEPEPVHLAQAKCYAAIYLQQNQLSSIMVRMTYCNRDTEDIKYFDHTYDAEEIISWFNELLESYKPWADFKTDWANTRKESIQRMEFPYPYRQGQRNVLKDVYLTILHEKKLFLEAPTGSGKTIGTIFPTVKAIGEEKADRLFYLTAKTITRTVAEQTFQLLRREQGLRFKTVTLTARDKICLLEKSDCNPEACPVAGGHFGRVNDAMMDLLQNEDCFDRETILQYAQKHNVCPFELSLDMSLFADGVICDYNYVFDPFVYLKRFFGDSKKGDYVFLVDEAHNLVDRGREMYSATLLESDLLRLQKLIQNDRTGLDKQIDQLSRQFSIIKNNCNDFEVLGYGDIEDLQSVSPLIITADLLFSKISTYLEEHDKGEHREEILEYYFKLSRFLIIAELLDEKYCIYEEKSREDDMQVKLFCMDPSTNLQTCMSRGKACILFSATLLPIRYYKKLLGGEKEDYTDYAESVFDPSRLGVFPVGDVSSRYSRRGETEYRKIAGYIHEIVQSKNGNYMVFFPSHAFLNHVREIYEENYLDPFVDTLLVQDPLMDEADKEQFLEAFQSAERNRTASGQGNLLGFCVLGGVFSEGIDLKSDDLIGAIIVGTGIPQVGPERNLLKEYFEAEGEDGFDFAYRYPGMNKVLQAAGRVIRTEEDYGIVALLDDRFLQRSTQRLFPREWRIGNTLSTNSVKNDLKQFWTAFKDDNKNDS